MRAPHHPRRPGVGAPAAPLTPDALVALQRSAGNRVARQAVRRQPGPRARVPVVQRAAYGLDLPTSQATYVDQAAQLYRSKKDLPIDEFVKAVMTTIAGELKAAGVPLFAWTLVTDAGAAGSFDSEHWKVKINTASFTAGETPPRVLGDLDPKEVTEVVGTLYHESRHADQDVVILRSLLARKQTPAQIHATTKIPVTVVEAVKATTYAKPLDADQVAHAERMFDVMYGKHKELLTLLMQRSDAFTGLDTLAQPGSVLADGAPHVAVFTTWQTDVLRPKLTAMAAAKRPTATEKTLRERLQAIDTAIARLSAAWTKVTRAKRPVASDTSAVRAQAGTLRDAVLAAYRGLEGEVDAFRVEAQVKAAFGKKLAKR
ncbi:hypothetical protein OMK64_04900 [Cellulomonas fimi]|uniref:hypothetical protein n=1 Tax=Cellulomonas fimi TaxID=1708 RepID=UPI00234C3D50|nr:hypothetical protein [Cellulomonas fimi]MDC7120866.1 hypothetical protein [Cellulomonas fimi]